MHQSLTLSACQGWLVMINRSSHSLSAIICLLFKLMFVIKALTWLIDQSFKPIDLLLVEAPDDEANEYRENNTTVQTRGMWHFYWWKQQNIVCTMMCMYIVSEFLTTAR